jgi:acyl-CoA synthetase (NDP forming)
MSRHPLHEILRPNSIAVAGASEDGRGAGFVTPLQELGFKGKIYPVNPKYAGKEILGLKAYASVRDIPGSVDFVISSIPSTQVLPLLDDCAAKGVKGIHFFTARFSETGRPDAIALEKEVLRRVRASNIRLIGPNCMGVYYPAWGMSFNNSMPKESGPIGLASQSGSVTGEIIEMGLTKGMHFSKGISYGNAIDMNESDYLEYFTEDEETKIILMYIEGVKDGKRFFKTLSESTLKKPVIIIKGGRGKAGTRATASHTASLAGAMDIWHSTVKQAGAIEVSTIDELIDMATAFYYLPPIYGKRVGVAGGSGGTSVMSADLCEEAGLDVIPFPQEIREEMKAKGNPIWDWIGNPVDFSISMGADNNISEIAGMMSRHPNFDLLLMFMNPPNWRGNNRPGMGPPNNIKEMFDRMGLSDIKKPLFVVVDDRGRHLNDETGEAAKKLLEMRQAVIARGLPVFNSIESAARTASKFADFYIRQRQVLTSGDSQ